MEAAEVARQRRLQIEHMTTVGFGCYQEMHLIFHLERLSHKNASEPKCQANIWETQVEILTPSKLVLAFLLGKRDVSRFTISWIETDIFLKSPKHDIVNILLSISRVHAKLMFLYTAGFF